jgi:ketosteroid isomerase-like protein
MRKLIIYLVLGVPLLAADHRQALLDADKAFDQATAARGLDGWMSFFADDALINSPSGLIQGKAALRTFYSRMFARRNFSIRWKPLHAEASQDGTLGYTLGVAEFSHDDESGVRQKSDGRYLTVWRKQADGSWKAVTDLGN